MIAVAERLDRFTNSRYGRSVRVLVSCGYCAGQRRVFDEVVEEWGNDFYVRVMRPETCPRCDGIGLVAEVRR